MILLSNLTDKAIKNAFVKLLEQMPLNKISVKLIVEECGINRNSFYYHYQDIPTLIETIIKEDVDRIIAENQNFNTLSEGFNASFRLLLDHKRAIYHIYNSISRDVFIRHLLRLCDYCIRNNADNIITDKNLSAEDREILIEFYKCSCFGLAVNWLENGMTEDIVCKAKRLLELRDQK